MNAPKRRLDVMHCTGRVMFAARWLMAPVYIGLLIGLVLLIIKFVQNLMTLIPALMGMTSGDAVLGVLGLVDLSLVANLLLVVVLAGWQGFVDPLLGKRSDGQPSWLALDFSALKLKLIGAIATIAALEMLESFMHVGTESPTAVVMQLAILLTFGVLGLMLAVMDRINHANDKG